MVDTLVSAMTYEDARRCVDQINAHMGDVRYLLLDLYEREGWKALGYANWRECAEREFVLGQAYAYRLLAAAEIERNISPNGEKPLPEGTLRPLAKVEPKQQREVWVKAVETAPNGKVTAAHVEHTVRQFQVQILVNEPLPEPVTEEDDLITTERVTIIAWELALGGTVTPKQVSEMTGISTNGAWRMLDKMSRVRPIAEDHGYWFRCL